MVLLLSTSLSFSQQEASVWYFGQNAGIKFDNSGNITALTDGQLNTSEGCATISDNNGDLLFYTDGVTIWNKNHNIMENGSGLMGNVSTSQSATIVPKPGSTSLFYVFTLDYEVNSNGFRYSIVDISLNSGLGEVTSEKNILIYTPSDEKLSIVKHANNIDFWVVTHGWNSNIFYSHLLTSAGLNLVPISSSTGLVVSGSTENVWGCMKISPDGSKLAISHSLISLELMNFDNITGVVSNAITLYNDNGTYGVEFSSNSKVLYASISDPSPYKIIQYDLTSPNIPNAQEFVYSSNIFPLGLQLGPNNKIYIAQWFTTKLGVINDPNIIGSACNIQTNSVDLNGRQCNFGLPPFITSFFNASFTVDNLCLGSSTQFIVNTSEPIISVTWDFGDAFTSSIPNPIHQYTSIGNYIVTATITTASGTRTKSRQITIFSTPVIANAINNQNVCGLANMNYDLSLFNATLLGSQSVTTFNINYFSSLTDLIDNTNILSTNFSLPLGSTTIFAKIYNTTSNKCYVYTNFIVTLNNQAIANTTNDYIICENLPYNNIEQFNLLTKNSNILGNQNASNYTISYHSFQVDANNGTNSLSNLYTNTLQSEIIYARIQNNSNPLCFATTTFNIKVVQQPTIINVTDLYTCDDSSNDGIALFNLNLKSSEILNGQSSLVFNVKYFLNPLDAQNNTNEILNPIYNSFNNQTIYYSISSIGNLNCSIISNFNLVVTSLPFINLVNPIFICDDNSNDEIGLFNLQSNTTSILGTQSASNYTVKYFLNSSDANANINSLPLNYQNSSNPQTIFVVISNNLNESCFAISSFQIGLYKMPIANQTYNLTTCDDDTNDGFENFDLTVQNQILYGTQSTTNFLISYYLTQSEADLGTNPISNSFTNTINPQTIYARVVNNLSQLCYDTISFQLIVKNKPQLNMKDVYSICQGSSIIVEAPLGFTSYLWSNGATTPSTIFTLDGKYSITVTQDYGDIICITTKNIIVYNSEIATIININTVDWTDNENTITVQVEGDGDYEYSIDGINYQVSNQFYGLFNGDYIVHVRDKKGCGSVKVEVFLLMYPKYFTPNEDGFNDLWQINFSTIESNMNLKIFDRYGKLISNFKGFSSGWDGKFNGNLLPSDDYWFVIERSNGKTYKGHFTLKR